MENKKWMWVIGIFLLLLLPAGIIIALDQTEDKLTYVSSTEYVAGDLGQVIVRLTDFQGTPLTATCTDTIQYPDKTVFISSAPMTSAGYGNYYHNFTVPGTDGVYTSNVNCTYGPKTVTQSKTFHVSLLNSQIQARFDSLEYNITSSTVDILQALNNTEENLYDEIITNRNNIQTVQNNLSSQMTTFENNMNNNFTYLFDFLSAFNESHEQDDTEIITFLQLINTTTTTTQNTLTTFQSQTTQNFQNINNTIIGVQTTTDEILNVVNNLTFDVNSTVLNITGQIAYLINLTETGQQITQDNFSTVINLINQLNQTTQNNFDAVIQNFNNFNATINYKLDWIKNTTNLTSYEISLILQYLNISFNNINILAESNNCWVGGQWVIFAEVRDHFWNLQTETDVTCTIETTNWGNATMNWDATRQKFKYYHTCDVAGPITWTITCNDI